MRLWGRRQKQRGAEAVLLHLESASGRIGQVQVNGQLWRARWGSGMALSLVGALRVRRCWVWKSTGGEKTTEMYNPGHTEGLQGQWPRCHN